MHPNPYIDARQRTDHTNYPHGCSAVFVGNESAACSGLCEPHRGGQTLMAKVTYMDLVNKVQGKYCKQDPKGVIFGHRRDTGANYAYHRHKDSVYDPTPAQVAQTTKFATAATQTATIMADPTQLAPYQASFPTQKRYKTLRGYIFADVMAKL